MKSAALILGALLSMQCLPAPAQQYHYSYGDSRVVNQNQTGLYMPSGTYIGAGTISRSAQGKSAGVGGLAGSCGLPNVNMGSHVRTPGDNIYDNNGTDRQTNGALIYKDQEELMAAMQRAKALKMQQRFNRPQIQGNVYIPGSNGAAANYGDQPQTQVIYRNGAASYGQGYGKGAPVRQF